HHQRAILDETQHRLANGRDAGPHLLGEIADPQPRVRSQRALDKRIRELLIDDVAQLSVLNGPELVLRRLVHLFPAFLSGSLRAPPPGSAGCARMAASSMTAPTPM